MILPFLLFFFHRYQHLTLGNNLMSYFIYFNLFYKSHHCIASSIHLIKFQFTIILIIYSHFYFHIYFSIFFHIFFHIYYTFLFIFICISFLILIIVSLIFSQYYHFFIYLHAVLLSSFSILRKRFFYFICKLA